MATSYHSLKGKRVFITGGGSGIGEALVSEFAAQGAQVAFVDIAEQASAALCARLAAQGLPAPLFKRCDITDIAALQATMADFAAQIGDFDVLVNNAANARATSLPTATSPTGATAWTATSGRRS